MRTWEELAEGGWQKVEGRSGVYRRPDGRLVSRKRQLSKVEAEDIGHLLFPKPLKVVMEKESMEKGSSNKMNKSQEQEGMELDEGSKLVDTKGTCMGKADKEASHKERLTKMALKLKVFAGTEIENLNISKSLSDLDDAMRDPANPLFQELPLHDDVNIFIDILEHALKFTSPLLRPLHLLRLWLLLLPRAAQPLRGGRGDEGEAGRLDHQQEDLPAPGARQPRDHAAARAGRVQLRGLRHVRVRGRELRAALLPVVQGRGEAGGRGPAAA